MSSQMFDGIGFEQIPAAESPVPLQALGGAEGAAAAILVALITGMLMGRRGRDCERCRGKSALSEERVRSGQPPRLEVPVVPEVEAPLALGEFWDATTTRFCPICRAEYISGTAACEDCGVDLVDEDDVPEAEVVIQEGTVRVVRLGNSFHGQLVREFLAANRIPCSVQRCTAWDLFGADVYVFESDALRAKKLIRHFLADLDVGVA